MIKKWHFYSTLAIIVAFLSLGFKPFKLETSPWFLTEKNSESDYLFPSEKQEDYVSLNIPYVGKRLNGFKEALALKESQGHYRKVNSLGYMGKYQFGSETLRTVGIKNDSKFLHSPALQEKAILALLAQNKWVLRNEIEKYCGKIIGGVTITESGILAAAHLGGAGSVKRFFKNNGKKRLRDAYGTSIRSYMKKFGGYDLSFITANSRATVHDM
ncbi:peptidoglycan-binding protein LysM [Flavobacterium agrisoli]|uniref:Peptidoglycan-binding protein LysM n=1 Tax=Flavobacterium agrisoli TaxID=2793066 RepID=A0A934PN44_9FLAO|nr:peptidoglycan-binding protein LysM [Flavobacterium agrisoli]MBK0369968.1 peptidoglycan-binding protein LysM [Flavobacterium agrisoli]